MKICVIGLGYIGLPTAALMASHHNEVIGVDRDVSVLENIRRKGGYTEEPGLSKLVKGLLSDGDIRLSATPEIADAFVLCLPTPVTDDKRADISYVIGAMETILPFVRKGNLIVLESTVPPGTTEKVLGRMLADKGFDPLRDVDVAHAPERVLPGKILDELVNLDRVMGGLTPQATKRVFELYSTFVKGKIMLTDATTAEFVKLVENSYRDVNIAFANELATLADKIGIDVWEAINIANHHPRVNIHRPGPGVGGHCIAVDPYFLVEISDGSAKLIKQARDVNSGMPALVVNKAEKIVGNLKGKNIAILGLAYKGNVGDQRESPAQTVIELLRGRGAKCMVHDPHVTKTHIELHDFEETIKNADLVIITTDHKEFAHIDPAIIGSSVAEKRILDTRHIIDRAKWEKAGWSVAFLGDGKTGA